MLIRRYIILTLIVSAALICEAQTKTPGHVIDTLDANTRTLLGEYSHFWIKDSTGSNGFRLLFARQLIKKCKLNGHLWTTAETYFGKPNHTKQLDASSILYLYDLVKADYMAIDAMYLVIRINAATGKIMNIRIDELDG